MTLRLPSLSSGAERAEIPSSSQGGQKCIFVGQAAAMYLESTKILCRVQNAQAIDIERVMKGDDDDGEGQNWPGGR